MPEPRGEQAGVGDRLVPVQQERVADLLLAPLDARDPSVELAEERRQVQAADARPFEEAACRA